MDGLICIFNPFFVKYRENHHRKTLHVPRLTFVRRCKNCGVSFTTHHRLKMFCSRQCKYFWQNRCSNWRAVQRNRLRLAVQEFIEMEKADPSLVHHAFPHSKRCLGTRDFSMNLSVVIVNGEERVKGAVWLERQIRKIRTKICNMKTGSLRHSISATHSSIVPLYAGG